MNVSKLLIAVFSSALAFSAFSQTIYQPGEELKSEPVGDGRSTAGSTEGNQ